MQGQAARLRTACGPFILHSGPSQVSRCECGGEPPTYTRLLGCAHAVPRSSAHLAAVLGSRFQEA